MTRRQIFPYLWPILILLLAVSIRLVWLDARALWFDEGVSLTYAQLPLSDTLYFHALWQDTNPPSYHILLGIWTDFVGVTAFTARYFSLLLGVLAVALTYHLGRWWRFGHTVSSWAMLLVAVSPLEIYYSREAKGYTFIQFFLLLMIALWLRLFPDQLERYKFRLGNLAVLLVGLALSIGLAIGAHFTVGLMLIVVNLWTLVWLITAHRNGVPWRYMVKACSVWLGAEAIVALAWLPWVLATASDVTVGAHSTAAAGGMPVFNPFVYLAFMLGGLAAGPVSPVAVQVVLGLLLSVFALAGWIIFRGARAVGKWLLAMWVAGPLLLGLGLQTVVPFFFPRFVLYIVPALSLLVVQGSLFLFESVLQRKRILTSLLLIVVALLISITLYTQYSLPDPTPDLRPLCAELAAQLKPGDALIYSYSWQPGVLDAYLPDNPQPTYYASFFEPGTLEESLQAILDRHGRVWLLTYVIGAENPINDVGLWLLEHGASPGGVWYDEGQLSLFIAPDRVHNPGPPETCFRFDGERIKLCFAPLDVTFEGEMQPPLVLALTWEASENLPERYVVFVHVLANGNPVPIAQQDIEPANGTRPTYTWSPGQPVLDLHAVQIPQHLVAEGGMFEIHAGLYDRDTLERVPVDGGGDSVLIGHLELSGYR